MRDLLEKIQKNEIEPTALQKIEQTIKNLRIVDLEIFISAAHMKNLGKAAKVHHLSQSATSTAILRVEAAFGIDLCTHERRQFRLTREGEILLPKIEKIIKEIRHLIIPSKNPHIRIVTTHAIAQISVPPLLAIPNIEFKHMRPDEAYSAILNNEADMALVLDNYPWTGVLTAEIGKGGFGLYCRKKNVPIKPILLPEDQMEVITLKENWRQTHEYTLPIKTRIPSWSLIGQICSTTDEVGFLPDFLARKYNLYPVLWQPAPSSYRLLAIYKNPGKFLQEKFNEILNVLCDIFYD